jgi:23S rRNA (guanosine2251-2'-O)-methyltransferase
MEAIDCDVLMCGRARVLKSEVWMAKNGRAFRSGRNENNSRSSEAVRNRRNEDEAINEAINKHHYTIIATNSFLSSFNYKTDEIINYHSNCLMGLPLVVKLMQTVMVLLLMHARGAHSFSSRMNSFPQHFLHHGRAVRYVITRNSFDAHLCKHKMSNRVGYYASICTTHHVSKGIDEQDTANYKTNNFADRDMRKERLHFHLSELGVDAAALEEASFRSQTTMEGFDERFGKSAIKSYRAYIDPKPSRMETVARENVDVAANRFARQIDFLAKRHRSQAADWVRHIDESQHRRTFPLILVLDNLRSAANVGSIYRSAEACGCLEILTTGITPHPGGNGSEKLAKSALGAEQILPTKHFATVRQAMEYLKEYRPNVMLVGMETTERSKLYNVIKYPGQEAASSDELIVENDCLLSPGVALFLGNEVSGVDTDIMPLLDEVVEIPMFGLKNSLNVAACAPVVMYEILRQWRVSSSSSSEDLDQMD